MAARAKYRREEPDPDQALRVLAQILAARLAGDGIPSIDADALSEIRESAEIVRHRSTPLRAPGTATLASSKDIMSPGGFVRRGLFTAENRDMTATANARTYATAFAVGQACPMAIAAIRTHMKHTGSRQT